MNKNIDSSRINANSIVILPFLVFKAKINTIHFIEYKLLIDILNLVNLHRNSI
jgi:hypothetical protein